MGSHFHAGGGSGGGGWGPMHSSHVGCRHTYLSCMERTGNETHLNVSFWGQRQ